MTTTSARTTRPTRVLAAAVLGFVALAAAVALLATPGQDEEAAPATAPVEVTGAALPAAGGRDAAVGTVAPSLSGQALDGSPLTIGDDGRAKAVVFLAHWCPHCRDEVTAVQAWLDGGAAPAGVDLYGVATGTDPARPNYPPTEWLEGEGWSPPTLLDEDDQRAGLAYGLTGYPYWVFIDGDGRVAARHTGALPVDQLERVLSALEP